jgi:hypothetical protein
MAKFEYPHQNLSLVNMKGERWKDIPNLEGYFMVSNLGRVKRLQREVAGKDGKIHIFSERIIAPLIGISKNNFKGDTLKYLKITVSLDFVRHYFMIPRLLYYCFIETFDLKDRGILILNKDCNGLNVNLKNLVKADHSTKGKRITELNRSDYEFSKISREKRIEARKKVIAKTSKEISQYTLEGIRINTFPNVSAAQREFGIHSGVLNTVATGRKAITAVGYIWRWGSEEKVEDIESIKEKRRIASKLKYGQKVTQYDFDGNKIAQYNSYQDAAIACSSCNSKVKDTSRNIKQVTIGKAQSAAGYFWQIGFGKDKINLKGYSWDARSSRSHFTKKVKQYMLDGKLLKMHRKIGDAAKAIDATPDHIRQACKSKKHISKGFIWKFA